MTAFFGFGATPPRLHRSLSARARSLMVPLCIAPRAPRPAPGSRPSGRPGDVGPEGRPPFVGRVFRACAKPGTGPVLRHSPHAPQHIMPESGRAPGPSAGPGSFLVTAEKFGCFPPSETPSEFLIRGLCQSSAMRSPCIWIALSVLGRSPLPPTCRADRVARRWG